MELLTVKKKYLTHLQKGTNREKEKINQIQWTFSCNKPMNIFGQKMDIFSWSVAKLPHYGANSVRRKNQETATRRTACWNGRMRHWTHLTGRTRDRETDQRWRVPGQRTERITHMNRYRRHAPPLIHRDGVRRNGLQNAMRVHFMHSRDINTRDKSHKLANKHLSSKEPPPKYIK